MLADLFYTIFFLLLKINIATSGAKAKQRGEKGSFPNKTVDCKERLYIEVNPAHSHSVHSFNNC